MSRSITIVDEEHKGHMQVKVKKLGTFDGVCCSNWRRKQAAGR